MKNNIPLKRGAQPEEVSKLVLFLAEDASYSTGSEFIIDGGVLQNINQVLNETDSPVTRVSGSLFYVNLQRIIPLQYA